jgi:hypothetical protein
MDELFDHTGSPFPEGRFSDGGSGGAARVVPDDFGTDWTAEITSCSNWIRKSGRNHMKITAQTEAVSSPPEEKWHLSQQWRQNTFRAGQKLKADWKYDLHNLGAGRKSRKPPTPFVGMKPYGKSQLQSPSARGRANCTVKTAELLPVDSCAAKLFGGKFIMTGIDLKNCPVLLLP